MKALLVLVGFFSTTAIFSQTLDPIVFSSKSETSTENMTSSYFIYDVNELEKKTHSRTVDLLKQIPGVEYSQTGLLGGQAALYIRGLESKHTIVLIDGVRYYDASNTDKQLNTATLNSLDIEKVEVLKGSQGVLYGADAIGGVINIITKSGKMNNTISYSDGYYRQLSLENTFDFGDHLFQLSGFYQQSEFASEVKDGDEIDAHIAKGISLNHSVEYKKIQFKSYLKLNSAFSEVDGDQVDDDEAYGKDESIFVKEGIEYNYNENTQVKFDISYHKIERENKYFDSFTTSSYQTPEYVSILFNRELSLLSKVSDGTWLYGISHNTETVDTSDIDSKENTLVDTYFNRVLKRDMSTYNFGARLASNDDFGSHLIYQLGYKRQLNKKHAVKFSNGTGFKTPSIFQKLDPTYGNKNLSPEKSYHVDVSYEYEDLNYLFSSTVYQTEVENVIGFTSKYANVDSGKYKGVEFYTSTKDETEKISMSLNFVNIKLSDGKEASRRPNFSYQTTYSEKYNDHHQYKINWEWKGRRFDINEKEVKPFDLWNLDYIYSAKEIQFITSFKNIFDREYEVARGYSTLGRSLQVTFQYKY